MEKIYGIERAKASEKIIKMSEEHEKRIKEEMKKCNLVEVAPK